MNTSAKRSFFLLAVLFAALILGTLAAVWYVWHSKQRRESEEATTRATAAATSPSVPVAQAVRGPSVRRLTLIGEASPEKSATLYANISGYLARIDVDVGDRVKRGQLIAVIQSPEIDQQILTLESALEIKRRMLVRTRELAAQGFFSQQALKNVETDVRVMESQIAELRSQAGYGQLRAPFAGVITARSADVGALVKSAASDQSSAPPVVTVADVSRMKVTVYVDRMEAPNVKPGMEAEIVDAGNPQRNVKGKVDRVSGELDAQLLAEVDFDNSRGVFVAGSFVNVSLFIPAISYVEAPASALVSRNRRNFVAVVTQDDRVQLRPVEIAGTDGSVVRVASGLEVGERVALGLPASVADGGKINPTSVPVPPALASPPASSPTAPPATSGRPPSPAAQDGAGPPASATPK